MEPRENPMTEAFAPLSREEVVVVLDDLTEKVERNPRLLVNRAFAGMVRLAVTAAGHAVPGAPKPPAPAAPFLVTPSSPTPPARVVSPEETIREAVDVIRTRGLSLDTFLLQRVRKAVDEVVPDESRVSLARSEQELASQKDANRQLTNAMTKLHGDLRSANATITTLRESHRQAQAKAEQAEANGLQTAADLRNRLVTVERALANAKEEATASKESTRTVAREAVLRVLRTLEWVGKSPKYTVRNTRTPVPCCPVCFGLKPDGINVRDTAFARDAGHQKGCALQTLIVEASAK